MCIRDRLESAIARSEAGHLGELRLVVEGNLALPDLWRGQTPRMRAIDLFSQLRVWDTELDSGVLIYLQLIDRRVEIVADRGAHRPRGAASQLPAGQGIRPPPGQGGEGLRCV